MLRASNFSSWNVSRGTDPRFLKDLLYLMSDALLACLAFCSMFPVPVSASLILLLPVTLVIQVRNPVCNLNANRLCVNAPCYLWCQLSFNPVLTRCLIQAAFMTQPEVIKNNLLSPTPGVPQSQLFIIVSFYVLQRHNLQLLRNYRKDYIISFRQRLSFLPQGQGHVPSNRARDRMIDLAQKILSQMTQSEGMEPLGVPAAVLPGQPSSAEMPVGNARSLPSSEHAAACTAISALVSYLQDSSTARSRVCDLSDICKAAIRQCGPLLKKRSVSLRFVGRQRRLPLRVLLVDDSLLARRILERLARNRGYLALFPQRLFVTSCVGTTTSPAMTVTLA
jgi:hypothetical protein